jgi:membrane-bound inhibitor of C-type lysozyme
MTRALPHVMLALLATAVAACAVDDVPGSGDQIAGTYQCDDGKTFAFTTMRGSEQLTLEIAGQSYQLGQVPGLSGTTRFSDGTLSVWTQGDARNAVLEGTAEPFSNCKAVDWETGGIIQ